MSKLFFVLSLGAVAFFSWPALAAPPATPVPKPLTESDLLNATDRLQVSDRIRPVAPALTDSTTEPKRPSGDPAGKLEPGKMPGVIPSGPAPSSSTEITAKEATFDQRAHVAVFTIEVVVVNPQFKLTSDKLTAYMKHDDPPAPGAKGATTTPKPAATPVPKATPSPAGAKAKKDNPQASTGGLEKAIAESNVIITQDKVDADGNITHNIGHGKKAVYEAATGDITLTGRPDVSQGINTCVATEEGTIIILNRDGHMRVTGPHKTTINESGPTEAANAR